MQGGIRRAALAVAGTACLAALVAATVSAGASADSGRHALKGSKPTWASAVPQTSTVASSAPIAARVWLTTRNADQLAALAKAVSDPTNAQYQNYLSASQYAAQFAPTDSTVQAVEGWLTGAGLGIVSVGPGNHYIAVSGDAAAVQSAFGTTLGTYAVNGQQVQAPTSDLSVPASLADSVLAITGLTKFGHMVKPQDFGAPGAFVNSTKCSGYYGQRKATDLPQLNGQTLPYAPCGYTPSQLRGVYGIDRAGLTGQGQTVAIVDAYDASTLQSDANTYAQRQGDRPFHGNQFVDRSVPEDATTESDCGGNGWYGEQTLDVEAVHAMAQKANVQYYGAASCYDDDLLAQLAQIVADDQASVVSNSWGEPTFVMVDGQLYWAFDPNEIDTYEAVFQQGAVEGIGFYFSSGDDGDEQAAYGYAHPDYPTGDPWVTSVGGTSLAIGRGNDRLFETGWGTEKYTLSGGSWNLSVPFLYGAGGGISQIFDEPWYQQGVVPAGTTGRGVPDIAMDADPTTGMLVGETQAFDLPSRFGPAGVHYGEYRIGGTSLACPLLAGVQADIEASTHIRVGFANPFIYQADRTPILRSLFYDVTPQGDQGNVRDDYVNGENADNGTVDSVRTFNQDSSLTTAPGWDDVTGVGTINFGYLGRAFHR
jgi:subtilase family serine protease